MYRDVFVVDTRPADEPNRTGPFQIPSGFQGDSAEYRMLIKQRYAQKADERRYMRMQSLWATLDKSVTYVGPYADVARSIVSSLGAQVLADITMAQATAASGTTKATKG